MSEPAAEGDATRLPPQSYWEDLERRLPIRQVADLRQLSDLRLLEFTAGALSPPEDDAMAVLDAVASDGWLVKQSRRSCPNCDFDLNELEDSATCPNCGQAPSDFGGVKVEIVYTRRLATSRPVDWVIVVHGMSTRGAWQEEFSWYFSTTWGRTVPVALYKYGFVVTGVLMAWRRRSLQRRLREKLAVLRNEAKAQGFSGKPDVVAHSFGTWLIGHMLEDELKRSDDRLEFGRLILAGSILRPDFDWPRLRSAGLVEDVLNHYGTKDTIVPLAHFTIWDSGPSGRRGFDSEGVLNIRADGYGHSDLFSVTKCIVNNRHSQPCIEGRSRVHHLEHNYKRHWRPFLTLPASELLQMPDRSDPSSAWGQWPALLRGTLFPFVALTLVACLVVLALSLIGAAVGQGVLVVIGLMVAAGIGLSILLGSFTAVALWRRVRSPGVKEHP